jgi:hypothetical protein
VAKVVSRPSIIIKHSRHGCGASLQIKHNTFERFKVLLLAGVVGVVVVASDLGFLDAGVPDVEATVFVGGRLALFAVFLSTFFVVTLFT